MKDLYTVLQGGHTEDPETYERMLSITSHQRDANENHSKIPLHTNQNGRYNQINKKVLGCGEKGTLVHCLWESRLVQPLWKTVWNFLRKLKMDMPFDVVIPLVGLYPMNPERPI